jgi:hypothetical protein
MRRAWALVTAASLSLAACGSFGTPAADVPGSTATQSATESGPPGFDPNDAVAVITRALESVLAAEAGQLTETRTAVFFGGGTFEQRIVTSFQNKPRALRIEVTTPNLEIPKLTFGYREGELLMQGPATWGEAAGTWYHFPSVDAAVDSMGVVVPQDGLPSQGLTALQAVRAPAWLLEGDESSELITYSAVIPAPAGISTLLQPSAAEVVEARGIYHDGDALPAQVTVRADGSLHSVSIDATDLLRTAVAESGPGVERYEVLVTMEEPASDAPVHLPPVGSTRPATEMPGQLPSSA